jgi:DNA polymerase-3 subunit chi
MPQVEFYVLPGADDRGRLKLACRLTERAYLAGQRVFIALEDAAQMRGLDEMLWTFGDGSFVPHEPFRDDQQWQETPVLLSCAEQPHQSFDLMLNLGITIPGAAALATQIAEIIDADETRRRAGRTRFRHYRDQGSMPKTHNLTADQTP